MSFQDLQMPQPPRDEPELTERQQEILQQLEAIFREEGFRKLTIGELAARLSCSRSTLYAIAPTKEELFLLAADRLLRQTGDRSERSAARQATPVDRLGAYLRGAVAHFATVKTPFMTDVLAYAPARDLYETHQRRFVLRLRMFLEEGIANGQVSGIDPAIAAEALDAALSRVRDPGFLRRHGLAASQAFDRVFELFRRGLEPRR